MRNLLGKINSDNRKIRKQASYLTFPQRSGASIRNTEPSETMQSHTVQSQEPDTLDIQGVHVFKEMNEICIFKNKNNI